MRNRFSLRWTKHLEPEKKEQFEKTVKASRTALDRLADIIREDMDALETQESSISDYTDAAWSHKQAHRNGERAFARKILDLLAFSK